MWSPGGLGTERGSRVLRCCCGHREIGCGIRLGKGWRLGWGLKFGKFRGRIGTGAFIVGGASAGKVGWASPHKGKSSEQGRGWARERNRN